MRQKAEQGKLVIHTALPVQGASVVVAGETTAAGRKTDRRLFRVRTRRRAPANRNARTARSRDENTGALTVGERLMRNTAIACALLLTVLAVKNLNQPWSDRATEGLRQAMTMRLDLDETLGRLQFVRALIPETALVFMNLSADAALIAPVDGTIVHTYSDQQPWLEYRCAPAQPVLCAADGVVTTVGRGALGDYIISVEHENGVETVYAYLDSVDVSAGETIDAGEQVGVTAPADPSRLYFELRENGAPIDPTSRLRASGA